MKLQEFIDFRSNCFVCGGPLAFKIADWTEKVIGEAMQHGTIYKTNFYKISHPDLSLFVNLTNNTYNTYPNESKTIDLALNMECKKDPSHYSYDSQHLKLQYQKDTWSQLNDIAVEELIRIDQANIFSIINVYDHNQTTVTLNGGRNYRLPLINCTKINQDTLLKKLRMYLTFL